MMNNSHIKKIKTKKNNGINSLALIYIYPSINRNLGHAKGFEFYFVYSFPFVFFFFLNKNHDDGIIV